LFAQKKVTTSATVSFDAQLKRSYVKAENNRDRSINTKTGDVAFEALSIIFHLRTPDAGTF